MANKMLIDTTHPEETRVVVVRGNRVEEFDFESANRRQLRGNIYLAKVTRVEPSLQAAFVEYGGNRHGFLAFSEIHPDYYQIPVADRQALIEEEERAHRDAEDEADRRSTRQHGRRNRSAGAHQHVRRSEPAEAGRAHEPSAGAAEQLEAPANVDDAPVDAHAFDREETPSVPVETDHTDNMQALPPETATDIPVSADMLLPPEADRHGEAAEDAASHRGEAPASSEAETDAQHGVRADESSSDAGHPDDDRRSDAGDSDIEEVDTDEEEEVVESVGGADALDEVQERTPRYRRQYKIQEVIKRRQVMLVQVVKEERGTKGAALTTYLSLAGRYSVLMPNTARGGGISRKITSAEDRKRLKQIATDLEVPEGMGVILRTAGANRTKAEVKRDFEYLLRMWETVRDLTLKSTAPMLVYEEGSLIKRAIRDLYNKDIDEVVVAGDDGYREAKDFMRMLMPSHAKNVKLYKDTQPILTRYGIESQLDAMFSPVVQLRSGGYIVINQAEALVAIDVNSGRATREHHIEDTALKTNSEAAEEIARQLRLRDLAGLIVIDFIDMDEKRNNRSVERKLKDCLKHDRARIQVGRISHFGLLEMSRQRIRSSVLESSTEKCPHCGGTGHVRSVASVTLQLLRSLEEALLKGATHNMIVRTRSDIALYVLNHKRAHLRDLESRFQITITVNADATINGQQPFVIERGEQVHSVEAARAIAAQPTALVPEVVEEDEIEAEEEEAEAGAEEPRAEAETGEPGETDEAGARRRRRRRRRGRRGEPGEHAEAAEEGAPRAFSPAHDELEEEGAAEEGEEPEERAPAIAGNGESDSEAERRRRRRGRRGGRRNRRDRDEDRPPRAAVSSESGGYEPTEAEHVETFEHAAAPTEHVPFTAEPVPAAEPPAARAEPEPQPAPPAAAPAVEPPRIAEEPPRRRSTVREPAPIGGGDHGVATPLPTPVTVEASTVPAAQPEAAPEAAPPPEEPAQPRRTGWWARRVLGRE